MVWGDGEITPGRAELIRLGIQLHGEEQVQNVQFPAGLDVAPFAYITTQDYWDLNLREERSRAGPPLGHVQHGVRSTVRRNDPRRSRARRRTRALVRLAGGGQRMPFRMNFHDVPASEAARAECEGWAEALRVEFPEVGRVEVTVAHDRRAHDVHVHVTGKDIDVAARGDSLESLHLAARDAFDKAHAQLRKRHDKMVLGRRRNAKNERGS